MDALWTSTGLANMSWRELAMLCVACLLLWLAIRKQFEPLLLVPIGFGALMANLPLSGLMAEGGPGETGGLFHYLFYGVKLGIFPPLIFLGVGALTVFGPLLSNPQTFFLGAAAQIRVFGPFLAACALGLQAPEAAPLLFLLHI